MIEYLIILLISSLASIGTIMLYKYIRHWRPILEQADNSSSIQVHEIIFIDPILNNNTIH